MSDVGGAEIRAQWKLLKGERRCVFIEAESLDFTSQIQMLSTFYLVFQPYQKLLGYPVQGQEFDLMTHVGPF